MNQRLYAFWRYYGDDAKPLLGGEVIGFDERGNVKVKQYPGFTFKPVKILPFNEGKTIASKLDKARKEFKKSYKAILAQHSETITNIGFDLTS
jgi:hypothetical protein